MYSANNPIDIAKNAIYVICTKNQPEFLNYTVKNICFLYKKCNISTGYSENIAFSVIWLSYVFVHMEHSVIISAPMWP